MTKNLTGSEIVLKSLQDQGVDVVFGYPGGAVLPIYDTLFGQNSIRHVLVRQEAGAIHAAEGYARSSGKVGVVLVTSGPGATNVVTGLTDALMDSIPIVCITGQVPSHLIGSDAFQECDTTGITRPCTKHNYLIKDVNKLSSTIHEAFEIARNGRPGPVVVDIPKDLQFAKEYGSVFGIIFQIIDDYLDEFENFKKIGKTPGTDRKQGKSTILLHMKKKEVIPYCQSLANQFIKRNKKYFIKWNILEDLLVNITQV